MLKNTNHTILEQCIWICANLASTHDADFEKIFETNILSVMKEVSESKVIKLGLFRQVALANANFAKCPVKTIEFIDSILCIISALIFTDDPEVQEDCITTLKNLCDKEEPDEELETQKLLKIAEFELIPHLFPFLTPANINLPDILKILGNLSSGDCSQVIAQIRSEKFFERSCELLTTEKLSEDNQKLLYWTCSNLITEGPHLAEDFRYSGMFKLIMDMEAEGQIDAVFKEACWCLCNYVEKTDNRGRMELISNNKILPLFINTLEYLKISLGANETIILAIMMACDRLLKMIEYYEDSDQKNPVALFYEAQGVEILDNLSY